jgi:hypothetical protein
MDPSRSDRILHDWDEVAGEARRPVAPPRRVVVRGGLSATSLAGAVVIVAALLIAVAWFGRPVSDDPTGGIPLPPPSGSPTAEPTPGPTPSQGPFATPGIASCVPADLAARTTMWEGAAGNRIAHVELTNTGSRSCTLQTMNRPQLVDAQGSVLIDGSESPTSADITFVPGGVVTTLVQAGNYCGPAPVLPLSVAFVLSEGRMVATPPSPPPPSDLALPPCLGAPDSPGAIEMHPWAT